jgi:K+-transporting ATPase KdpF subunit
MSMNDFEGPLWEARDAEDEQENESMTFGESITLLIAIGVMLYLIYALLWPERF